MEGVLGGCVMGERPQKWNESLGRYAEVTDPAEIAGCERMAVYRVKPHEETWHASMTGYSVRRDDGTIVLEVRAPFRECQVADLELASAAPDMARVLLGMEWVYTADVRPALLPVCPVCHGTKFPHPFLAISKTEPLQGHTKDCALDAALRKAGVRG